MDALHEKLDVLHRSCRQNAVAQVEDMALHPPDAPDDLPHRCLDRVTRAKKGGRVEVALDRALPADEAPRLIDGDPPVYPYDVPPALAMSGRR